MSNKLILASNSARRRWLLESAGIKFDVEPSDIVEQAEDAESPEQFAQRMANEKAKQVARRWQERDQIRAILGADTIVVLEKQVIGKPKDRKDAHHMLETLSGKTHRVITAACLISTDGNAHSQIVSTDVTFKHLTSQEIDHSVDNPHWSDKAGAYAGQEHAAYMVRSIRGSYTNV
ncbi:MAG: Maf family protein, partial [Pseudomonadota bacterium]